MPRRLYQGVLLNLFSRTHLQLCEHSSAISYDVFVAFACNLSGGASAIERGSFGPVGFVRLQMQKLKPVRFVARRGVSPVLEEVKSKPRVLCSLTVHRLFSQGFCFQGLDAFWHWSAPFKLILRNFSRFTHKS